jgi:BirA family biotin operon repressor/biotin-[acetyl-CoA-carboxylase] ligase
MKNLRKILEKTFVAHVEHHAAISSTNDRAIQCAASLHGKLPLLIIADCQTAGRGRGPNRWWTGPGSLAFSLLVSPESAGTGGSRSSALISLAAGLAVVEVVKPLLPGHEIGIHWPNDVMLDGRKLAGILIEVLSDGKQVIGIGLNANNTAADAPEEVRPRVATLRDATGQVHDSTDLLIAILGQLQRQLVDLSLAPEGVALRTHDLCLQRGKRLQIIQGERRIDGLCLGIAANGALLLEIDGKSQAIYSGVLAGVE